MSKVAVGQWVCCPQGEGFRHENGAPSNRRRHFKRHSVGLVNGMYEGIVTVWFIGADEVWDIASNGVEPVDVINTGDKFESKICNICHCLLPLNEFEPNQNNLHGVVRRPSCRLCRTDIDKRAPKSSQAKMMEQKKPKKGTAFECPICRKRSIVGVTARIVADHNHHTGDIRDFICDSCNTGLGRFKNGHDCLRDALAYLKERDG